MNQLDLFIESEKQPEKKEWAVKSLNYEEIREGHRFKGFSANTVWKTTRGAMTYQEALDYVRFKEECCRGYAGQIEIVKCK